MGKKYINLHIFSAHAVPEATGHATSALDECLKLIGVPLHLTRTKPVEKGILEKELPDGVMLEESEDLAPRTLRLARLGRMHKDEEPDLINELWFDFDPSDVDPAACGSPWGWP